MALRMKACPVDLHIKLDLQGTLELPPDLHFSLTEKLRLRKQNGLSHSLDTNRNHLNQSSHKFPAPQGPLKPPQLIHTDERPWEQEKKNGLDQGHQQVSLESRLEPKSVCTRLPPPHAALCREKEKKEKEKKLFQAHTCECLCPDNINNTHSFVEQIAKLRRQL